MTDRPTKPAPDSRSKRPTVVNADRPSETMGVLPGVGEGASAAHFARDAVPFQAGEGEKQGVDAPADPPADRNDRAG